MEIYVREWCDDLWGDTMEIALSSVRRLFLIMIRKELMHFSIERKKTF